MKREDLQGLPYGVYVVEWEDGSKDVGALCSDRFSDIKILYCSNSVIRCCSLTDDILAKTKSLRLLAHVENNEVKVMSGSYDRLIMTPVNPEEPDKFIITDCFATSYEQIRNAILSSYAVPGYWRGDDADTKAASTICATHSTDHDKEVCPQCEVNHQTCIKHQPPSCPYCGKPVGNDGKCEKGHIGSLPPEYKNSLV